MMEEKLRPIERLFLISKERKDVFNKKNALHCLIYSLLENKNIYFKKKKFKLNVVGTNINKDYEELLLNHLRDKNYIELDKLVNSLNNFNKTLIDTGFLINETKLKKFLFMKFAKQQFIKTSDYFNLQGIYSEKLQNNIHVIDVVCPNNENKEQVLTFYSLIKKKIIQAYKQKEIEKNKKSEKEDDGIGGMFK